MALSDVQIRNAKPGEKRYSMGDSDGLLLEVMTSGSKFWRLRYWKNKKEFRLTLGEYPAVTLQEARQKRDEIKMELSRGVNPKVKLSATTFEAVALEWYGRHIEGIRTPRHAETVITRLKRFLFPALGSRPIAEIKTPELLAVLREIEARGIIETAHRVKQIAGQVFRYGIAIGFCEHDLSADLRGALPPNIHRHHGSVHNPRDVSGLLQAMAVYSGSPVVKAALWFSLYTFQRPGEIRGAEWGEIDLDAAEWRIPAARMKIKRPHVVPLSRQVVEILVRLKPLTGKGRYVFPSLRSPAGNEPISENTVRVALRTMGYSNERMTPHGFRSLASTNLNEQGWDGDLVELQLAHIEQNTVRAAYNFAERLPERRMMMQAWADWLDDLKDEVVV